MHKIVKHFEEISRPSIICENCETTKDQCKRFLWLIIAIILECSGMDEYFLGIFILKYGATMSVSTVILPLMGHVLSVTYTIQWNGRTNAKTKSISNIAIKLIHTGRYREKHTAQKEKIK